jgi:hypothetical protein
MSPSLPRLALRLAALAFAAAACADPAAPSNAPAPELPLETLNWGPALPVLPLEPVGKPSVRAWFDALPPGRANDESPWKQLIYFKKDKRIAQKSYFAVADFAAGTVRELPVVIPAMQPWATRWLGGKLYIGFNLPERLAVFDPATETLTDLGPAFSGKSMTLYRVETSTDGLLLLGGGTGSDISLFDPKTGTFDPFGQVAANPGGGTYAYSLSGDSNYVYAAVRSSDPWELVRLDRKTRERKVLLTAPAQAFLAVNGNTVERVAQGEEKKWYNLADGILTEVNGSRRPPQWKLPGPGFTGKAPELAIDQAPVMEGDDALTIHLQAPGGASWKQARLPLRPDVEMISHIGALGDGRLVGLPSKYFAMVLVDPRTGATRRCPLRVSAYGMLPVGDRVFIAGYPMARVLAFDATRPMTWEESVPGRPGVPDDDPAANPKLIKILGQDTGGAHLGMRLNRGSDGNVYMIARRHRYFYGFSLAWFNPAPDAKGDFAFTVFDDKGAFNHLQIRAMQAVRGGTNLLITTEVQPNKQLPGEAPDSAAVFLFDVPSRTIAARHEPLPGAQSIETAALVGPDLLVGVADNYKTNGSTLFRYNLKSGTIEQMRRFQHRLGDNLALQPDGLLWGSVLYGNYSVLFTIDPATLDIKGLGRTEERNSADYFFHQGAVYLSGFTQLMRVKGLSEPITPILKKNVE